MKKKNPLPFTRNIKIKPFIIFNGIFVYKHFLSNCFYCIKSIDFWQHFFVGGCLNHKLKGNKTRQKQIYALLPLLKNKKRSKQIPQP